MRTKITPADREEIAADCRAFINSRGFQMAFDLLEQNYVDLIKSSNIGELSATTAHASLHVLENVKAQLANMSKGNF